MFFPDLSFPIFFSPHLLVALVCFLSSFIFSLSLLRIPPPPPPPPPPPLSPPTHLLTEGKGVQRNLIFFTAAEQKPPFASGGWRHGRKEEVKKRRVRTRAGGALDPVRSRSHQHVETALCCSAIFPWRSLSTHIVKTRAATRTTTEKLLDPGPSLS